MVDVDNFFSQFLVSGPVSGPHTDVDTLIIETRELWARYQEMGRVMTTAIMEIRKHLPPSDYDSFLSSLDGFKL